MNRFQIRRRVQGLLRDDTYPVEVINEALNRVLLEINGLGRFRFQENASMITLQTGQFIYPVDSSQTVLTSVPIGTDPKFIYNDDPIIAEEVVVYRFGETAQAVLTKLPDLFSGIDAGLFTKQGGPPQVYARYGTNWYFDPIPDTTTGGYVVTIFCYRDVPALVTDLDIPKIPSRWHGNVIVYGVAADLAPGLMVRSPEGNILVGRAYQMSLQKMIQQEGWDPYTDKRLLRDDRWVGFENIGRVGTVR